MSHVLFSDIFFKSFGRNMFLGVIWGVEHDSDEETARKSTSRCLNSNFVILVQVGKRLDFKMPDPGSIHSAD